MSLDFTPKDVIHSVAVKFVRNALPGAKKPYYLKAVHQPELDIHGIASKADLYNVTTPPKVIEEGLTAGMEIMCYLAADGYRLKTPIFNLALKVPGGYDGAETHLSDGTYPEARIQVSHALRNYLKTNVRVEFDGIDNTEGLIACAVDEATGLTDTTVTMGSILSIYGMGLKVENDEDKSTVAGVFFKPADGLPIKAELLVVNEPKTLKVLVPSTLIEGTDYQLAVFTQSPVKNAGYRLKLMRDMRSDCLLTAKK